MKHSKFWRRDLVGTRFWRDPTRTPYKHIERYLGQKRVLYPLFVSLFIFLFLFSNYIVSLPSILTEVFPNGLFGECDWKNAFQLKFFFQLPKTNTGWLFFFLISSFCTFLFGYKLYRVRKSFMPLEDVMTAATSRWADGKSELDYQYPVMPTDDMDAYDGPSGMVVGTSPRTSEDQELNRVREYISSEPTNVAIVGETRVGKGVFGVEKAIDGFSRTTNMKEKRSMNIHDPSGELYLKWKKTLEKRKYKVLLLNLNDTAVSDTTNPLALVVHYYKQYLFGETTVARDRGLDQAQAELATLCYTYFHDPNAKEPIWQNAATALFTAGSLALIEESLLIQREELSNMYTIVNMIAEMNNDQITTESHPMIQKHTDDLRKRKQLFSKYKGKSVLDFYFQELPLDHPAHLAYLDILASSPAKATIGNVVTHMLTNLKAFRRPGNAKLMAQNSINYMDLGFGEQPVAVFVVVSDQDKSNHEIAANYFDQSFKELTKAGLKQPNRKLPRQVVFLYEEAGNMVKIPELATKMTDGLKVGLSHVIVLQNYEQLDKYGDDANTIIANCGNTIVVKTKSKKTREMIVEDLGNRANLSLSRQGKIADSEKTLTDSMERIPMLTKDELSRLPFGQTVVIRSMKTHDLKGNVIENMYPIYNRGETKMLESWKYLPYEESTWEEIEEEYRHAPHTQINLSHLLYMVDPFMIEEKEERRQAILEGRDFEAEKASKNEGGNQSEKEDSVRVPQENHVEPQVENLRLKELDTIFDVYFTEDVQQQHIQELDSANSLSYFFKQKLKKDVRIFCESQENPQRIEEEYEQLLQSGTIKDIKKWLANVGREPLYERVIQSVEKNGFTQIGGEEK
ncbi:type IV secretory system conjugative DNA transfer family protein [uncultured Enterococcus sp.]|uniref:type IV secretory system conjugative DNA transfer family protein n=1 Tax=uncultured Enterococcus sp. TaxID=167972 RepID=UPI00258A6D50|nr:type IV secretory system conjugative DNA transfer family protein [uncultured Enterococcus sp.]